MYFQFLCQGLPSVCNVYMNTVRSPLPPNDANIGVIQLLCNFLVARLMELHVTKCARFSLHNNIYYLNYRCFYYYQEFSRVGALSTLRTEKAEIKGIFSTPSLANFSISEAFPKYFGADI